MEKYLIKFDNIYLKFGQKEIFSGLDLLIKENEKVIISGRSGIGKSSLFSLLLGFTVQEKGSVLFRGEEIGPSNIWDIRQHIAYVDQDSVSGTGKVSDWIRQVSDYKVNRDSGLSFDKVIKESEKLDMDPELFKKDISELSGGERQRVSISLALASGRRIFLLDEITSALDDNLKTKVADMFLEMKDATVTAVSHDPVWTRTGKAKIFDLEGMKWQQ